MSARSSRREVYAKPPLNPHVYEGRFEFNGVANPTVSQLFGTLVAVTRLTSTGGVPFYRIRMSESILPSRDRRVHFSPNIEQDVETGDNLTVRVPVTYVMPSATAPLSTELDIVIFDAGVASNSVPTGRFFSFAILDEDSVI